MNNVTYNSRTEIPITIKAFLIIAPFFMLFRLGELDLYVKTFYQVTRLILSFCTLYLKNFILDKLSEVRFATMTFIYVEGMNVLGFPFLLRSIKSNFM